MRTSSLTRNVLIGLILYFYIWTATGSWFKFNFSEATNGAPYHLMTEALFAGQLHLLIKPAPELLALPDPYDPSRNGPYKLHDASLYKGKYYYYFGPTPVFLIYAPIKLLTNLYIPDNLVILIFGFGGFIWAYALILFLHKQYFNSIPEKYLCLITAVLGIANWVPFLLRRTEMYEVAISCGLFFLNGAIYSLIRGAAEKNPNIRFICIGSLFLGLSIGARPQFALSSIILLFTIIRICDLKTDILNKNIKSLLSKILIKKELVIATILPFTVIFSFILIYNFLRFDNPFEFGGGYQLPGYHVKDFQAFRPRFLLPGIHLNLLDMPAVNKTFPFIYLDPSLPNKLFPGGHYHIEGIIGAIPAIPFVLLTPIILILFWVNALFVCKSKCPKNGIVIGSIITLGLVPMLGGIISIFLGLLPSSSFINELKLIFEKTFTEFNLILMYILILLIFIISWIIRINSQCLNICFIKCKFPLFEFCCILFPFIFNLFIIILMPQATMRYIVDYASLFILITTIVWFYFDQLLTKQKFVWRIAVLLGTLSIITSSAISIHGCYQGLSQQNQEEFNNLKIFFERLIK